MRITSDPLEQLLSSGCRAGLVRWLAQERGGYKFTLAQASKVLGRSRTSLAPEVRRLEKLRVLDCHVVGPLKVYELVDGRRWELLREVVNEFGVRQLPLFNAEP